MVYIYYIVYIYNFVYPSPLKVLHREGSGRPPRHCSHSAGSRRAERRRRAMALHPLHLTASQACRTHIPSGKLTQLLKMVIYSGFSH